MKPKTPNKGIVRELANMTILTKRGKMKEKGIELYLVKQVKALGGQAFKLVLFSGAGFPDRTVLLPKGRIAFVELKSPGQKPRKIQWFWIKKLRALGFHVFVCDTYEKVDTMLWLLSEVSSDGV